MKLFLILALGEAGGEMDSVRVEGEDDDDAIFFMFSCNLLQ